MGKATQAMQINSAIGEVAVAVAVAVAMTVQGGSGKHAEQSSAEQRWELGIFNSRTKRTPCYTYSPTNTECQNRTTKTKQKKKKHARYDIIAKSTRLDHRLKPRTPAGVPPPRRSGPRTGCPLLFGPGLCGRSRRLFSSSRLVLGCRSVVVLGVASRCRGRGRGLGDGLGWGRRVLLRGRFSLVCIVVFVACVAQGASRVVGVGSRFGGRSRL